MNADGVSTIGMDQERRLYCALHRLMDAETNLRYSETPEQAPLSTRTPLWNRYSRATHPSRRMKEEGLTPVKHETEMMQIVLAPLAWFRIERVYNMKGIKLKQTSLQ